MSVSRIARAPQSHSSSINCCESARGTMARTANQPARASGDTVGDSSPGVSLLASATASAGTS